MEELAEVKEALEEFLEIHQGLTMYECEHVVADAVRQYVRIFEEGRVFSTPRPTSGPWLEPGSYLVVPLATIEDE